MFWKSKMICTYFFLFKIFHAEHLSLYDKIAAVQLIPLTSVVLFWIKKCLSCTFENFCFPLGFNF